MGWNLNLPSWSPNVNWNEAAEAGANAGAGALANMFVPGSGALVTAARPVQYDDTFGNRFFGSNLSNIFEQPTSAHGASASGSSTTPGGVNAFDSMNSDITSITNPKPRPTGLTMPGLPGGLQDFMGNPAVVAAVNAQIAAMNTPLRGQIREERRDLKDRTGMHKKLGKDFKGQAKHEQRLIEQQTKQREAARAVAVQEASADYEKRQAAAQGGVQVDDATKQRMQTEGLTQEQRLRDLMRADAEFAGKGSDSTSDLISGYATSSDANTRQSIDRDVTASGDAVRGIRDQMAGNRQMRPQLLMQLGQQFQAAAQQAFENQMGLYNSQQAQRQQRYENRMTDREMRMNEGIASGKLAEGGAAPDYSLVPSDTPGHMQYAQAPQLGRPDVDGYKKSLVAALGNATTAQDLQPIIRQWAKSYGIPMQELHNNPQLYAVIDQVVNDWHSQMGAG